MSIRILMLLLYILMLNLMPRWVGWYLSIYSDCLIMILDLIIYYIIMYFIINLNANQQ